MTSFGDPNAPKFCYGRKEDTPVNWDLNWKNQIEKEKREMKARESTNKKLAAMYDKKGRRIAPAEGNMGSSRMYHPTHVSSMKGRPEATNSLNRIRMGVCGTFIHEADPFAPSGAPPSVRGSARGSARPSGRVPLSNRSGAPESSRSGAPMSYRQSARSYTGASTGRHSTASAIVIADMEQRLQSEQKAREVAEAKIMRLTSELSKLKQTKSY